MCNSGSQNSSIEIQLANGAKPLSSPSQPPLCSRPIKVPETGPIDLEALEKDNGNVTLTLNPNHNISAHILSSGNVTPTGESYDVTDDQNKSPNVYINGLPPHFPEDQLFELAAPFGEIRSVRSFTRHVGEKESGYGFVLFETVDAAEKCIQSLRRFRNLHPTFSKQSHKIPGMPYTQSTTGELSFKTKMERLQDPNSTNLYIEGCVLFPHLLFSLVTPFFSACQ
ncbi:hypothetical protein F5890DRAFT_1412978 [Lentinula detonsa]|uniref:RRM domain-containing protein n=1 Tax=Lentinula detonsa TaxID=2804962 RepID=A0AA38PYA8_9AGAR|nr:hypothetical protein F5890DRAFT_1412978 [Lentinula detonsa]